jgi:non-lysosomal glucosylceramidase
MKWPVLCAYDQDHIEKIALPVGGIGTGTVSLGGRGDLRDWEIVNRPAKGFTPEGQGIYPFLAVYAKEAGGKQHARLLEGPVEESQYEGGRGSIARNHGFPRFRHCAFEAAYPFGQVLLSDPDIPIKARLKVFNPLIPADADASSYPAAVIRVELENLTADALETSVCFSMPNFIGEDGSEDGMKAKPPTGYNADAPRRVNRLRDTGTLTGIHMTAPGMATDLEQSGDIYLATGSNGDVTHRTAWADLSWGDTKLDFWDDFTEDGQLDERTSKDTKPVGSLCVSGNLAGGETREVTFLLTWRFPNRRTWSHFNEEKPVMLTNHYSTCFADAVDAAGKLHADLDRLERTTLDFVGAVCATDLPKPVLEAALFNLSTLRSQTCFRTADGKLYGWEGCDDKSGCCSGSCTHVWNYEHSTPFLFGELAKGMREIEFQHATDDCGKMAFRVDLPLDRTPTVSRCNGVAAADGQMGCVMKLYREWQLSGDDAFLKQLYPRARKSLEFCWIKGGWDADRDGVMEGSQHNTMDVEYYGPNPQMGFWYLGALRAMEAMAGYLGDDAFATTCRALREKGAQALDERLFNGDYYEHIVEPKSADQIADGLRYSLGSDNLAEPDLQLGAGCLVDQLVGQYTAHVLGLGLLSDREKHQRTLASIFEHNFKKGFHDHFNHMRSYVLGDESAVLMASYPKGRRPKRPFPYFNEVMTGFEYVLAIHMLYEGMTDIGLQIIEAIRDRYDGKKRSPFDEAECGHHYARAMAAWSAINALTGFQYSGVSKRMDFRAVDGTFFWSTGYAWGTCCIAGADVRLNVLHGTLALACFHLTGQGEMTWPQTQTLQAGDHAAFTCTKEG